MAKPVTKTKSAAPAPSQSRSVARPNQNQAGVPAHLQGYESTGAGVPTDQSEFLIPMARVLDPKSPEVDQRGNANAIKGAQPGDIYIKNAPTQIIKGETGFLFQPCYRDSAVIEWLPRAKGGGGGTGFVARHPADFLQTSKDVTKQPHPEDKKKLITVRKSSGNPLVETRYYGGYAISDDDDEPPMPLVIPFASTGHTVAKQWNMLLATKRINGARADIWLVYYRVATRLRQRNDQAWYLFDVSDAGDKDGAKATMWAPTIEDVERGRSLHESLARGEKQFEAGGVQDDDADGDKM